MRLIYRCANCGAQNECAVPKSVSLAHGAEDVLAGKAGVTLNMWVRHPCATDLHGIAPLVAIVDD